MLQKRAPGSELTHPHACVHHASHAPTSTAQQCFGLLAKAPNKTGGPHTRARLAACSIADCHRSRPCVECCRSCESRADPWSAVTPHPRPISQRIQQARPAVRFNVNMAAIYFCEETQNATYGVHASRLATWRQRRASEPQTGAPNASCGHVQADAARRHHSSSSSSSSSCSQGVISARY